VILQAYLPQQLTEAEVRAKVEEAVKKVGAQGRRTWGRDEGAPAGGAGARRGQAGERARQGSPLREVRAGAPGEGPGRARGWRWKQRARSPQRREPDPGLGHRRDRDRVDVWR